MYVDVRDESVDGESFEEMVNDRFSDGGNTSTHGVRHSFSQYVWKTHTFH